MKWTTILILAALTLVALAQDDPSSNDTFVIPNLVTTAYTTNRRRGTRANHIWFTLIDNGHPTGPKNSTCEARWPTTEAAPSKMIRCEYPYMAFSIHNFTDLKDFELGIADKYRSDCQTCCSSPDQFIPWAAIGSAEITRDGVKWKRTRTTSGGTVSAVVDQEIVIPIEYQNMCESRDDDSSDGFAANLIGIQTLEMPPGLHGNHQPI